MKKIQGKPGEAVQHSHIALKASVEGAHLFAAKIGFRIRHNFLGILLGSKSNSLVHKLLLFVKKV